MKITKYKNCTKVKINNRKISVYTREDGTLLLEAIMVSDKESASIPRAGHLNLRDSAVVTSLAFSREGAVALLNALYHELDQDKVGTRNFHTLERKKEEMSIEEKTELIKNLFNK
jgi:hypothetical protein